MNLFLKPDPLKPRAGRRHHFVPRALQVPNLLRSAAIGTVTMSVALTCALWGAPASAQTWPAKPIRVIVPYAGGGGTDILSRLVGERLQQALGQTVLIENRPGANGVIGSEIVARSSPDGSTFMVVVGTHVINAFLMKKVPYDAQKDFTPVTILATSPMVLVSGLGQPFATLRELIAHARVHPGKLGIGNSEAVTMLTGELFKSMAKVDMTPIAYKGGGPLMTDVIGGHIPLGVTSVVTALQHYKAGKLRVLGVGGAKRTAAMPDVPTVVEGGLADFNAVSWYGMLGPANLPKDIALRLQREISKIVSDAAVRERIVSLGGDPVGNSGEEFAAFMRAESEKWGRVVREANVPQAE